jgi:hypothetical protein
MAYYHCQKGGLWNVHWLGGPSLDNRAASLFPNLITGNHLHSREVSGHGYLRMAKHSKERYLILSVDDSRKDSLNIQLALSDEQRGNFSGSFADSQKLTAPAGTGQIKFPMPALQQLDMLMSRKGAEVVDWLQNQPFEETIVLVLPRPCEANNCSASFRSSVLSPSSKGGANLASVDLVNFLERYLDHRH